MMTIDNLPAQLPKDASTYFSDILTPILKKMIKAKKVPEIIERATIMKAGALVKIFQHLQIGSETSNLKKDDPVNKILVLGAGYVSKPAVDYLSRIQTNMVTIGTDKVNINALSMAEGKENVNCVEIDISNTSELEKLISCNDIVLR